MAHSALQRIATLQDEEGLWSTAAPLTPSAEEREQALQRTLFRARELTGAAAPRPNEPLLSTGLTAVDRLLDGGIARGETVELVGRRSRGRFSVVLSLLAATTRAGEAAALVDLGDELDPQTASLMRVELERLLWLRPRHLKQALGAAELLLQTGFVLVVIDLGQPPVPGGRGAESFWTRLVRGARDHRSALLVSSPYRAAGGGVHTVLELRRSRASWLGRGGTLPLLGGLGSEVERARARGRLRHAAAPQTERFALRATSWERAVTCDHDLLGDYEALDTPPATVTVVAGPGTASRPGSVVRIAAGGRAHAG